MTANFGRDIRAARLNRGWSRQRLAEESGVATEVVVRIESGGVDADLGRLVEALQLEEVSMLLPAASVAFLRVIQPVIQNIPQEMRPIAFAAVLDALGRAAAGVEPLIGQQVNLLADGDIDITKYG